MLHHADPFALHTDVGLQLLARGAFWRTLAKRLDERQLIELPIIVGQYQTVAYYQNSLRLRLHSPAPAYRQCRLESALGPAERKPTGRLAVKRSIPRRAAWYGPSADCSGGCMLNFKHLLYSYCDVPDI
jgi:hypothetical protein